METLKHTPCTVSWVAQLGHSWLSQGKATWIFHGRVSSLGSWCLKVQSTTKDHITIRAEGDFERTNKADKDQKNRVRKRRVVGRIYGMKYRWKGHKDRNGHKSRINRSGQAQLLYVKDRNCNIPTTWKWAYGDFHGRNPNGTIQLKRKEKKNKSWAEVEFLFSSSFHLAAKPSC